MTSKDTASLPRVFIGSSSEGLEVAESIQKSLAQHADPVLWNQGVFRLTGSTLDSLIKATDEFDFGVFVFTPDDLAEIKGEKCLVARDNVVFELGLFVGRLGRERCFIVIPARQSDLRLPSDLNGVTTATYDPQQSAPVASAVYDIREAIKTLRFRNPMLKALSDRLVYLLLHLGGAGGAAPRGGLGPVLAAYDRPGADMSPDESAGWGKASDYACQYLASLGLVEPRGHSEVALSRAGRELVGSDQIQQHFQNVFTKFYDRLARAGRVLYDSSAHCDEKCFEAVEARVWDDDLDKYVGPKGRGLLRIERDGVITLTRKNDGGKFEVWLRQYVWEGALKTYIPKHTPPAGRRELRVSCQAQAAGGEHVLRFVLKNFETYRWVADKSVELNSEEWVPVTRILQIPPGAGVILRLDYESAPPERPPLRLRKLVVADVSS